MASSFSTNLGIEKPASGELSGTWGDVTNFNFDIFDRVTGAADLTASDLTTDFLRIGYLNETDKFGVELSFTKKRDSQSETYLIKKIIKIRSTKFPTVAIIGESNSGKSWLINNLTGSKTKEAKLQEKLAILC